MERDTMEMALSNNQLQFDGQLTWSGWGVYIWWNGMVEWNSGMDYWDGGMLHRTYLIIRHVLYSEQ